MGGKQIIKSLVCHVLPNKKTDSFNCAGVGLSSLSSCLQYDEWAICAEIYEGFRLSLRFSILLTKYVTSRNLTLRKKVKRKVCGMSEIVEALGQMAIMLAITIVGFVATKVGVLRHEQTSDFTRLLLNITLPCMLLASVNSMQGATLSQIGIAALLALFQFAALMLCAVLCNLLFRTPHEERSIYIFMAICTNTGFIGLPVISSIYGTDSVLFCGIFIAVLAFFVYSVGFGALIPREPGEKAKIPWKAMVNPAMIASVVAIVLVLVDFQFPSLVEKGLSMVGNITAPVAMLMVGIVIADAQLGDVFKEWRLYPFIAIRQLIVPALLFLLLNVAGVDRLLAGVFVVMFAMPVGSMAPAFAQMMGRDPQLPARGTVLSTLASFIVVPLLVIWMTVMG